MENLEEKLRFLFDKMGFGKAEINVDSEHRKVSVLIDDELVTKKISDFLPALEQLINLILKKMSLPSHVVDLNYYRRERERLILELAKAAAHRAMLTKDSVELPPMNAYERRLVHLEITAHPELKTESLGVGRDRRVVIKHINPAI